MSAYGTGDDAAFCGLCGKETSVAMIAQHLVDEHGIDPETIRTARIVDASPQGGEFMNGASPEIERIQGLIAAIETACAALRGIGYPCFLHLYAPGEHSDHEQLLNEYAFGIMGPIVGPVDLWRQAARRSKLAFLSDD
jgi:hypothetical protein